MPDFLDDANHQQSLGVGEVRSSTQPLPEKSTPKSTKTVPTNAFEMIMSGGKNRSKKRKRNIPAGSSNLASRFVACPLGCGNHILLRDMNKHLDACLLRQAIKDQIGERNTSSSLFTLLNKKESDGFNKKVDYSSTISPMHDERKSPEPVPTSTIISTDEKTNDTDLEEEIYKPNRDEASSNATTKSKICNGDHKQHDVFAHMMTRSAKVFSEQEACSASLPKLFQRVHLHENGSVTLTCFDTSEMESPKEKIAWSATIQVRGKKEKGTAPISLLLSSDIPSCTSGPPSTQNEPERIRLVRNHSRLSVPVLKSILQKGIRRRKPLPSVRVASELADKSLGDLLRRLPIIILEDSTLHPSFPFVIWLMMAVSKNFQPPPSLLKRVLSIVFEIASCRWKDSLGPPVRRPSTDSNESNINIEEKGSFLSLASLHQTNCEFENHSHSPEIKGSVVLNNEMLIVWSILMRGQYGGMACDTRMLQGYAELWHKRFTSERSISEDVNKLLLPSNHPSSNPTSTLTSATTTSMQKVSADYQPLEEWNQVPAFVHKPATKYSACRIDSLMMAKPIVNSLQSQQPSSIASSNYRSENRSFVGLSSLCKPDITLEGVDFHCSSVLDTAVLSDPNFVRNCVDLLEKMDTNLDHHRPATNGDRRSWLEGVLKSCMWNYSGGVNYRLPLVTTETKDNSEDKILKGFYDNIIRPRVLSFIEVYVNERLSKR